MKALFLLSPSLLAIAWLVSKAAYFWNKRPDLQFGWVVLMLCGYLFYESWEKRPPVQWRFRWWAALLGVAGVSLLFLVQIYMAAFGTNSATMQGLTLGVLLLAAANVAFVFGWTGCVKFAMPYGFILVAMPLPAIIQGPLVNGLQWKVAMLNTEVLNLIGIPAQQVGSLIHLPNGTVGIDEACSGIRSLQSTVMASLFIGYLTLQRISLRIVLLVLGVGLAVFGNLVRSLYLCLTAHAKGVAAIEKVHDQAGWSILIFTAVGVFVLSWLMAKLEKSAAELAQASAKEQGAGSGEQGA